MRPCRFYAKNRGKEGFVCEYEEQESVLYFRLKGNKDFMETNDYCDKFCPKFAECVTLAGETFRSYRQANVVVNEFADGRRSILKRKSPFAVPERVINDKTDKTRSFIKVNSDLLFPRKPCATLSYLHRNIYRAGKRAKDTFYGYAMSNTWSYFFTFTFSPELVENRYNSDFTNALWSGFQRRLKFYDKEVRIANVPENHKDGAQHFHAFITFSEDLPIVDYGDVSKLPQRTCKGGPNKGKHGFCTYKEDGTFTCLPECKYKYFLVPYYEFGELRRDSLGSMLFCLNKYPYGICSCAILPADSANQQAVSNYLAKYLTKESNLGYNKKRFMHTRNLANKTKITLLLNDEQFEQYCQGSGIYLTDSKSKFDVYRNFGDEYVKTDDIEPVAEQVVEVPIVKEMLSVPQKWEQQQIDFGVSEEKPRRRHKEF